ncbi:MAG: NUDIX domain-containing protein [Chlamydiia bacterium]
MTGILTKLSVYGILQKGEGVLMQRRINTSFANGWWSLPGGHIESEESVVNALTRELFEELGIQVHPEHCSFALALVRQPSGGSRYVNFFYSVRDWAGEPTIRDGKASELLFASSSRLPNPTLPYIREALDLVERRVPFHESRF